MTADERLALIQVKIERSQKHITDLHAEIRSFWDTKPYEISAKRDLQSRKPIYYVNRIEPIPFQIAAITGDAIQNLRSALDHLAQQLFVAATGATGTDIHFPIDSSAAQYKANAPRKIKGLRQDAIDAINSLEPYDGGKGRDFWVLNQLNRIDKHRLLLVVGGAFQSVDIGPLMAKNFPPRFADVIRSMPLQILPADRLCPLKKGDELFIGLPDGELDKDMKFTFDIAVHEPGIVESKPLLVTLQHFADLVSNTVVLFKPCLS